MSIETYVRFRPVEPLDKSAGDPVRQARARWSAELDRNPDVLSYKFMPGRIGPPIERDEAKRGGRPAVDITIEWASIDKATATFAHRDLATGPRTYMLDAEVDGATGDAPFHVIIAGTSDRYPVDTRRGRWPRRFPRLDPLRLIPTEPLEPGEARSHRQRVEVLERAQVAGFRAIVLHMPEYPLGGLHGGHVVALLRGGRSSYALSLHFERARPDLNRDVALVLSVAEALRAVHASS